MRCHVFQAYFKEIMINSNNYWKHNLPELDFDKSKTLFHSLKDMSRSVPAIIWNIDYSVKRQHYI